MSRRAPHVRAILLVLASILLATAGCGAAPVPATSSTSDAPAGGRTAVPGRTLAPTPPPRPSTASLFVGMYMDPGEDVTVGWAIEIDVANGSSSVTRWIKPEEPPEEPQPIALTFEGDRARVRVSEQVPEGYIVVDGWCHDPSEAPEGEDQEPPRHGTLQGTSLEVDILPGQLVGCTFQNRPRDMPPATLEIEQWLDADGNDDTEDGGPGGPGWVFEISAQGGSVRDPVLLTRGDGMATTRVRVDGAQASVRIAQLGDRGAAPLSIACWDVMSEDNVEGTDERGATTIPVSPDVLYHCRFTNVHP